MIEFEPKRWVKDYPDFKNAIDVFMKKQGVFKKINKLNKKSLIIKFNFFLF